ncbi:BTB/POZ domain-containing protein At2g46260-like [Triticum dicoccoides]|uniref:BTB/POZ domain-containing protein At2g46260-like n=1 Tax=Triticum dicoccoides TaxID=85692 RepID=UPI00188E5E6C|nr:BTB/POZ domain-containing protein At2g46260-like [Triticum dicoccoides]
MDAGKESASAMAAGAGVASAMELDLSRGGVVPSFDFAFDSATFSDRVLRIEIGTVSPAPGSGGGSAADQERRREEEGEKEQSVDSSSMMVGRPLLREKNMHINSAILASRSPFFLKFFSNGMKESDQTNPTIRITDSGKENAFMELLSYMYSGKLTIAEPTRLLGILMAADKFEVLSCMRHCSQLLISLPMTTESALIYIDHPCSVSVVNEVWPFIDAAKEFLANKYKDFYEFKSELMNISLAGIKAIFSSTDVQVETEDDIYYFMLDWARARYVELEERRKILSSRLLPLEILASTDNDIDREQVTHRIAEALLPKAYPKQMEGALAAEIIVYLDLTREECSKLFPSGRICPHPFRLLGWGFYLMATCEMDEQSKLCSFGLWLGVAKNMKGSSCFEVDYEFAARKRSSGQFVRKLEGKISIADETHGCSDLFGIPWSTFIANDNLFINGVLHLRADLTVLLGQPKLQA